MPFLTLPPSISRRSEFPPRWPFELNLNSWQARGLVFALPFFAPWGKNANAFRSFGPSALRWIGVNLSYGEVRNFQGRAIKGSGSGSGVYTNGEVDNSWLGGRGYTLIVRAHKTSDSGIHALMSADANSSSKRLFQFRRSSGLVQIIRFNSSDGVIHTVSTGTVIATQNAYFAAATFDATLGCKVYVKGPAFEWSSGTSATTTANNTESCILSIAARSTTSPTFAAAEATADEILEARAYDYPLTLEQIKEIYQPASAYDLYRETHQRFYSFPAAAAGDITPSPTAGTLTLTAASATLKLKVRSAPTAGSLTLTAATATAKIAIKAAPTAGTLTLTAASAALRAITRTAPSAGTLTITPALATAAIGYQFAPTAGTLTLTAASAALRLELRPSPTAGALTITANSATAQVGNDVLKSPTAQTLTLTGAGATAALALRSAPTAGTLTITPASATSTVALQYAPSSGALALTAAGAAVVLTLRLSPSAGSLSLAGVQPDVVNTGFVPVPTPAPAGDTGGAGEARGITEYGRRRQRTEQKVGPAVYGPSLPEEEEVEVRESQLELLQPEPEASLAELRALREAIAQDEDRVALLGRSLEELDEQIRDLATRRQAMLLLLLLGQEIF